MTYQHRGKLDKTTVVLRGIAIGGNSCVES